MTITAACSAMGSTHIAYDSANQLISVASVQYNGLSNRLGQTVNDVTTSCTFDLNTGPTQVLADGTNVYTYGLGRISQTDNSTAEYFLGDALGSVRQMTDQAGVISFGQDYDPYGAVTHTSGVSQTDYGFTGESYGDSTQLIYLRARYYNLADGRFQSRDTWDGDKNRPMSMNRWGYVEGNPINYIDPTGLIKQSESADADKMVNELRIYNVFVKVDWGDDYIDAPCGWNYGEWTLWELTEFRKGVIDTSRAMGGLNAFIFNYGYINVEKRLPKDAGQQAKAAAVSVAHLVVVNSNFDNILPRWSVVHELGHVWDRNNNQRLSDGLVQFTMQYGRKWTIPGCDSNKRLLGCNDDGYVYYDVLAGGSNSAMNPEEDFANSFSAYVYPVDAQGKIQKYLGTQYQDYLYYTDYTTTLRWKYVDALVQTTNNYRKQ